MVAPPCWDVDGGFVAADADAGATSDASADSAMDSEADVVEDSGNAMDGSTCEGGATACGARCVELATDPAACGRCGNVCPRPAQGGEATCALGMCEIRCNAGFHRCGAQCASDDSALSCGMACTPCPVPAGAVATCTMGMCGFTCSAGYDQVGAGCELRVPRPIAPMSTSSLTTRRPTLRWELPAGVEGAAVELCRDRALAMDCVTENVVGDRHSVVADLAAGPWFWRLKPRNAGVTGMRTSATWQFHVPPRNAVTATSWGTTPDFNGDGRADIAVSAPLSNGARGEVRVFNGSAALSSTPSQTISNPEANTSWFGSTIAPAGDVDGDGFGDLLVNTRPGPSTVGRVLLLRGSAAGLSATSSWRVLEDNRDDGIGSTMRGVGDVDGDGYGDVAVSSAVTRSTARVFLFRGGPSGLESTPSARWSGAEMNGWFGSSIATGDFNGDQLSDIAIGEPSSLMGDGRGRVHIVHGRAGSVAMSFAQTITAPAGGGFGSRLSALNDANDDGRTDLVVSAPFAGNGAVYVFAGGATFGAALTSFTSASAGDPFAGWGVGDVTGDGRGALMTTNVNGSGNARLYLSNGATILATAAPSLSGFVGAGAEWGRPVASLGDINGDGRDDVAIAASRASAERGAVVVYLGGLTGLVTTAFATLTGSADGVRFGESVAGR